MHCLVADAVCLEIGTNPNMGFTSFDNFGWAFLSIFHILTLEGWTDNSMNLMLNVVPSYLVVPFYVALILLGTFFALNLLTAIISTKFA